MNKISPAKKYFCKSIRKIKKEVLRHKKEIKEIKKLPLQVYQKELLFNKEKQFIKYYNEKAHQIKKILNDDNFLYIIDTVLIHDNILQDEHIYLIHEAYEKIIKFNDQKINPRDYPAIQDITPDMIDSHAKIKFDLTNLFRQLGYIDIKITSIIRALFDDNSRLSRKAKKPKKEITVIKDGKEVVQHQSILILTSEII